MTARRTRLDQDRTPLLDGITALIGTDPAYFRIPGHRLARGMSPRWTQLVGERIFAYDVTETPLTDDLHDPKGAIREAQELLADLYGADRSFFLVNGSTCGNEAMLLSAAGEGEKVMVARNAHKSALMGLILSGANPVYVMPRVCEGWGIQGGIAPQDIRECFAKEPDCRALFLVSPSYYGICSDLREIADICHEHGALLLVDEAHGGHVYFNDRLPMGALEAGADMCVQSMHKVTGALTQSSVLHVKDHGVGREAFERVAGALQLVESTSPSYLLMASLDCARYELAMHGGQMMEKALALTAEAREKISRIPGFRCMDAGSIGKAVICEMDATRLVISAAGLGLTGAALEDILFRQYGVNMELSDAWNVLAVVTYANEQRDLDRLVAACTDISKEHAGEGTGSVQCGPAESPQLPQQVMTPRRAHFSRTRLVDWQDAVGEVAGQMIAPYPPGIPAISPGELMSQEIWDYIERLRQAGRPMHGTDEQGRLDRIRVIDTP